VVKLDNGSPTLRDEAVIVLEEGFLGPLDIAFGKSI
jgi:hypothetical protein